MEHCYIGTFAKKLKSPSMRSGTTILQKTSQKTKKVKILWNFSISTDRSLKANRPDIIFMDKNAIECLLIYVAVPADIYVSVKEFL